MSANLADLVRRAAQTAPDRPALLFQGSALTWAQVDTQVDALARGLLGLGLAQGDRVALQLGNTPDFPLAYFAVLRAGLVAVPVNTSYTAAELGHVLGDSGARAVVTGPDGADRVRQATPGLEHVVVAGPDAAGPSRPGRPRPGGSRT